MGCRGREGGRLLPVPGQGLIRGKILHFRSQASVVREASDMLPPARQDQASQLRGSLAAWAVLMTLSEML